MKKIITLSIFSLITFHVFAQNKVYIDDEGMKCDSAKASSFIYFYDKSPSDSVFRMEQYTMENVLLTSGGYYDNDLTILHGPFKYYTERENGPLNKTNSTSVQSAYFLQEEGVYYKGKREGPWITYLENGAKRLLKSFHDDQLHGAYITYSFSGTNEIQAQGEYQNGILIGGWKTNDKSKVTAKRSPVPNLVGNKPDAETRRKMREEHKYDTPARPSANFEVQLRQFMAKFSRGDLQRETVKVIMSIDHEGKISLKDIEGVVDGDIQQQFNDFFSNARWAPARVGKDKIAVKSYFTYHLTFSNE